MIVWWNDRAEHCRVAAMAISCGREPNGTYFKIASAWLNDFTGREPAVCESPGDLAAK